jgi:hypothetical protein
VEIQPIGRGTMQLLYGVNFRPWSRFSGS